MVYRTIDSIAAQHVIQHNQNFTKFYCTSTDTVLWHVPFVKIIQLLLLQIMARLREDRKLAAKFYSVAAVSIAGRLSELSPLDLFL
jgi:hypothetical protein